MGLIYLEVGVLLLLLCALSLFYASRLIFDVFRFALKKVA